MLHCACISFHNKPCFTCKPMPICHHRDLSRVKKYQSRTLQVWLSTCTTTHTSTSCSGTYSLSQLESSVLMNIFVGMPLQFLFVWIRPCCWIFYRGILNNYVGVQPQVQHRSAQIISLCLTWSLNPPSSVIIARHLYNVHVFTVSLFFNFTSNNSINTPLCFTFLEFGLPDFLQTIT